ncbi:MAG: hypothetical protein M3305_11545 [Actinomycetota bacterium]|nr:hypothetical protein [Actinomycetota bacterium]
MQRFVRVCAAGDMLALLEPLLADIILWSDDVGKALRRSTRSTGRASVPAQDALLCAAGGLTDAGDAMGLQQTHR